MFGRFAFAALCLSASAVAQAHDVQRADEWDRIALEANSWGRMVSGWSIGADGSGSWWERKNVDGTMMPNGAYTIAYHSFEAGPEGFAKVKAALADIPYPAPDASQNCENFMTDAVYGTVRMTRMASTTETAWNEGCMDDDYVAFMGKLRAASQLTEGWGKAAGVSRLESFDENGVSKGSTFPDEE